MCPFQADELEQDGALDILMPPDCLHAVGVVSIQFAAETILQVELVIPMVY